MHGGHASLGRVGAGPRSLGCPAEELRLWECWKEDADSVLLEGQSGDQLGEGQTGGREGSELEGQGLSRGKGTGQRPGSFQEGQLRDAWEPATGSLRWALRQEGHLSCCSSRRGWCWSQCLLEP